MNYQSPIDVITGQMNIFYENEICRAVQKVGVYVDKNELLRALQYDRRQYQKGYADRDSEIVRCKDCKWWHESKTNNGFGDCGQANGIALKSSDWFCADGERKDDDA